MKVGPAFLQTFAIQVLQSAMSVSTGILIARGLGPAGQGRYALFAAAIGLGVILASLGQFESNVLSSEGHSRAGRQLLARSVLQSAAVALILFASLPLWRAALGAAAPRAVLVFFPIVLALEVEAQLLRGINLGQHQITAYNLSALIQRLVFLSAVAGLMLGARVGLGNVLGGWAAAAATSVIITGLWVWRRSAPASLSPGRLFEEWTVAAGRGMRALVTIAVSLMLVRCDIWMLGPLLGVGTVGQMSVAVSLAEWLWYVPYILGNILFAAVAADKESRAVRQVTRAARGVVTLVVPMTLVMVGWGAKLVPLIYGSAYAAAGHLFVILAPGMAAIAVHIVVDSYFAGQGYPAISVFAALGALIAKVALNLAVIPHYGASGAAAVTVIVYGGLLAVKVVALARATRIPIKELLIPMREDVVSNWRTVRSWLESRLGLAH